MRKALFDFFHKTMKIKKCPYASRVLNYRNDLVSHLISEFESGNHQNLKQNFTLVTAITFIDTSLKKVKQETIKNCF